MSLATRTVGGSISASVIFFAASACAATVIDFDLLNATNNGGGDEPAGLSTNFQFSNPRGGDTIEDAFGNVRRSTVPKHPPL